MQALQSMSVSEGSRTWSAMLRKQLSSVSCEPKTERDYRRRTKYTVCVQSAYFAFMLHICKQSSNTAGIQSLFKQTTELLFRTCFTGEISVASGSWLENTAMCHFLKQPICSVYFNHQHNMCCVIRADLSRIRIQMWKWAFPVFHVAVCEERRQARWKNTHEVSSQRVQHDGVYSAASVAQKHSFLPSETCSSSSSLLLNLI